MDLRNDAVRAMLPQVEKKQESQVDDTDPQISDDDEEFSII